jgi:acyl transferase domain-containing protein
LTFRQANVNGGHFLTEDISLFDAPFFNITPEEAKAMDPQLRLQLETSYEALESAGLPLEKIAGSQTSVYGSLFTRDYQDSIMRDTEIMPRYFVTGNGTAMLSNRLSYFYDFKGPSLTVDTGCSTSLVALHLACQSLRTGEATMSLVGGSNVILNPDMLIGLSNMGLVKFSVQQRNH